MIRTLLASTAIAALLTAGAFAQDAAAPATPAETTVEAPTSILATGYTVTDKDNLATEIIGKQVYSSDATDAEHIGDVNNLVVGDNGEIAAVVIGVGGFLGMGESYVVLDPSSVALADDNGTWKAYVDTSKEDLSKAPKLDYSKFKK